MMLFITLPYSLFILVKTSKFPMYICSSTDIAQKDLLPGKSGKKNPKDDTKKCQKQCHWN